MSRQLVRQGGLHSFVNVEGPGISARLYSKTAYNMIA